MREGRLFMRISTIGCSDVAERNEVKGRHIVDLQKNMSQSSPTGILKISDAELGTRFETSQLQEGPTEGYARISPIKSEKMEPFKFSSGGSGGSSAGSLLSMSISQQVWNEGLLTTIRSRQPYQAVTSGWI